MSRRRSPPLQGGTPRLPELGLAEEILAAWDAAPPAEAPATAGTATAAAPQAAPRQPLDPDLIYRFADSLEGAGEAPAAPAETPRSWLTFRLAGETYALPVACVHEILRVQTITRVPHAPAPVRGITHLRGRVLAVVDLRVRLGLPAAVVTPASRIVAVAARERLVGLLVDAAEQVVKLLPSAVEAPPADVMTPRSEYIAGVYPLGGSLLVLLDAERALELDEAVEPLTLTETQT